MGYNMFAYCFNNPVNMSDSSGDWPSWNEIKSGIGKVAKKIGELIIKPIEARVGVGQGIGGNLSRNVVAEFSRDSYLGLDDGKLITGNVIVAEGSIFDSKIKVGDTYDHRVEENGKRVSVSGKLRDGPFDMMNYPDVTHGNEFAFGPLVVNSEREVLISASTGVHLGIGGHVSLAYNLTEAHQIKWEIFQIVMEIFK